MPNNLPPREFSEQRNSFVTGAPPRIWSLLNSFFSSDNQVAVLADGFAWNGKSYPSLSKVAFAITGTRWNGPKFFGLREYSEIMSPRARRNH